MRMRPLAHSTPRSMRVVSVGSRGHLTQVLPLVLANSRSGQLIHRPVPLGSLILPSSAHVEDTAVPLHCFPTGQARGFTRRPTPLLVFACSSQTNPSGHDSQNGLPASR